MADHERAVRPPMPLYVGTQNDGLFLLDKPPSPAPYDGPIPARYGPAVVIGNWPNGSDKAIKAVARYTEQVDAYVRALEAERDRLRGAISVTAEQFLHAEIPPEYREHVAPGQSKDWQDGFDAAISCARAALNQGGGDDSQSLSET